MILPCRFGNLAEVNGIGEVQQEVRAGKAGTGQEIYEKRLGLSA
jgi:hypothetical protein